MMNEFHNDKFQKVNKAIARRMFRAGFKVYVLPCKVRFDNMWMPPFLLQKDDTFDRIVSEYEYRNCNAELGYYCSYYVENMEVKKYEECNNQ